MTVRAVEGKKLWTGGKAITVDRRNKVISLNLRSENNLIIWDEGDNEIYVDLQLPNEIEPTDAFPVGITTGRVIVDNGWDFTGTIVCFKTTSGDNIKLLYADDGKLYIDNGTGTFKQIYLKGEVDALLQALREYVDEQLALKQDKFYTSSDVTPQDPNEGDEWYDTTTGKLYLYDGTDWNEITYSAGTGISINQNNEIVNDGVLTVNGRNGTVTVNEIIVYPTAPSNPTEGTVWYDTTNDLLKVYNGNNWDESGGDVKVFQLADDTDITTGQEIWDWRKLGKTPMIYLNESGYEQFFVFHKSESNFLYFKSATSPINNASYSGVVKWVISIKALNDSVTNIYKTEEGEYYLSPNRDYSTPYNPQYDGSPATKKYVDDNVLARVDSTAPANPLTGQLWYDTTNSTLNVYDGTAWQTV